jgi:hypothetical protein
MSRVTWLVATAAAGSLSAGVAVGAGAPSETTPVTADFQASIVAEQQHPCDANHTEFRVAFKGTQTSSDPRLTGDIAAKVRTVVSTASGYGYTSGKVVIRDHRTMAVTFRGRIIGVVEPDGGTEGFLVGHTAGPSAVRLLANFNVQQDPQSGDITGELGKDSQTGQLQDPAVLTNACQTDDDG